MKKYIAFFLMSLVFCVESAAMSQQNKSMQMPQNANIVTVLRKHAESTYADLCKCYVQDVPNYGEIDRFIDEYNNINANRISGDSEFMQKMLTNLWREIKKDVVNIVEFDGVAAYMKVAMNSGLNILKQGMSEVLSDLFGMRQVYAKIFAYWSFGDICYFQAMNDVDSAKEKFFIGNDWCENLYMDTIRKHNNCKELACRAANNLIYAQGKINGLVASFYEIIANEIKKPIEASFHIVLNSIESRARDLYLSNFNNSMAVFVKSVLDMARIPVLAICKFPVYENRKNDLNLVKVEKFDVNSLLIKIEEPVVGLNGRVMNVGDEVSFMGEQRLTERDTWFWFPFLD